MHSRACIFASVSGARACCCVSGSVGVPGGNRQPRRRSPATNGARKCAYGLHRRGPQYKHTAALALHCGGNNATHDLFASANALRPADPATATMRTHDTSACGETSVQLRVPACGCLNITSEPSSARPHACKSHVHTQLLSASNLSGRFPWALAVDLEHPHVLLIHAALCAHFHARMSNSRPPPPPPRGGQRGPSRC